MSWITLPLKINICDGSFNLSLDIGIGHEISKESLNCCNTSCMLLLRDCFPTAKPHPFLYARYFTAKTGYYCTKYNLSFNEFKHFKYIY